MNAWMKDELRKIAEADDLHISPFREDGVTYGTPTWIWSVAVGDALYVRAYNGRKSRWYQAAVRQKVGRITAAGMTREAKPSSPARARLGTRTRLVKHSLLRPAADGCSARAGLLRRSVPGTLSGSSPARSIGMVRHQQPR